MAINKVFYGVRVTAYSNGTQIFSGRMEELPGHITPQAPPDRITVYGAEGTPSVE